MYFEQGIEQGFQWCGVYTAANGTMSDGSGLSPYTNNADCKWLIAPSDATHITITFTEFATEVNYDLVTVWQCSSITCANSQIIAVLSGTYATSQTFTSTTGFVRLDFISDGSNNDAGFTANWTASLRTPAPVSMYVHALVVPLLNMLIR